MKILDVVKTCCGEVELRCLPIYTGGPTPGLPSYQWPIKELQTMCEAGDNTPQTTGGRGRREVGRGGIRQKKSKSEAHGAPHLAISLSTCKHLRQGSISSSIGVQIYNKCMAVYQSIKQSTQLNSLKSANGQIYVQLGFLGISIRENTWASRKI